MATRRIHGRPRWRASGARSMMPDPSMQPLLAWWQGREQAAAASGMSQSSMPTSLPSRAAELDASVAHGTGARCTTGQQMGETVLRHCRAESRTTSCTYKAPWRAQQYRAPQHSSSRARHLAQHTHCITAVRADVAVAGHGHALRPHTQVLYGRGTSKGSKQQE
jgi:hypothetical protein